MWQYQNTEELYHHGVLGMKWGVRRYQNADGTLTPAGKKRANKLASKYAEVTGKKLVVKKKTVSEHKEKDIKQMSDQELQRRINRINMEKTYSKLTSPKETKSRGKRFIDKVKKDIIVPAAVDAGRAVMTKAFKNIGFKMLNEAGKSSKQKTKTINKYKDDLYKEYTRQQKSNKKTKKK